MRKDKPTARTCAEMRFYASLNDCPKCSRRVDPDDLRYYAHENAASFCGPCRHCRTPLAFPFRAYGDPLKCPQPLGELGVGFSEIISPKQFIDEILRLSPSVDPVPAKLELAQWDVNREINNRVRVCLAELIKFIPAGADSIPAEEIPPEELSDLDARPEHYRRHWIEPLIAHHQRVIDATVADLPRVNAIEKLLKGKRPKGIDYLDRNALIAHEQWVERGSKGNGRLVLVGARHKGLQIGRGVVFSGARLHNVDLTEANLEEARLIQAELENVRFVRGLLYRSHFDRAVITAGSLEQADLRQCEFSNARITGAGFDGADLQETVWAGARVEAARFVAARFGDANLDGATFAKCDFRQADLRAGGPLSTRARFEHCDLRDTKWDGRDLTGTVFIECQFDGATGLPPSVAWKKADRALLPLSEALLQPGPRIAAWDLSSSGDGSLRIVAFDSEQAAVIARGPVPADARIELEQHLVRHGLLIGSTCRACGVYWAIDDSHCLVVTLERGIALTLAGPILLAAGQRVAIANIHAVHSFIDDANPGHRGVKLQLADGSQCLVAEEHDPAPALDPSYGRMNLEVDAGWIVHLGRQLAAHWQVPHHDDLWGAPPLVVEIEERESPTLDLWYIQSGQRGDLPMPLAVAQMAEYFAGRVEQEVAAAGEFVEIYQPLPELETGGYIALDLKPRTGATRGLELRVESPSGENKAAVVLLEGTNADVTRFLRAASLPGALIPAMERLTAATRDV